ncbi:MAG: FixH family protein [Candidatus Rokubacteria bacterium]|nr:FixH family protein [Candidatus Rokubacteria bacterium]
MTRWGPWGALVGLLLLPCEAGAGSFRTEAREITVELSSDPARPAQGRETVYTLSLQNAAGRPVAGAKVTLMGRMPDGMTVLTPLTESSRAGLYSGKVLFTMEGAWRLTVRIVQTSKPLELSFTEQVGR